MRPTRAAVAAVLSLTFALAAARAHSPEQLEQELGKREPYFQPVDRPAPEFTLQDAAGHPVALADLAGKVVVLNFIYASCPDFCPLHSERIADVQTMVNRTPMKDLVRFVSITTDPANDTAEVLRAYGSAHGLDPHNWVFLTVAPGQPEDATRKLAEAFGHSFAKADDGYQVHGVVTHVIDRQGRWRGNVHGLAFDPANLVTFVNALTNEPDRDHEHEEPGWLDRLRSLF